MKPPVGSFPDPISPQDAATKASVADPVAARVHYFAQPHPNEVSSGVLNVHRATLSNSGDSINYEFPHQIEGGRLRGFLIWGYLTNAADSYTARIMKAPSNTASGAASQVGDLVTSATASGVQLLSHTLATPSDGNITSAQRFFLQIQLINGAGSLHINNISATIQDDI